MTTKQLKEWLFLNSQSDQWWISLDEVTEENPMTIAEIVEILKSGQYANAQVLHISQDELVNPPWIDIQVLEPTDKSITEPIINEVTLPLQETRDEEAITDSPPRYKSLTQPQKNPGVAAVLSFFVPGLGQIYNGQIMIGIVLIPITIGLYFMVIGFFLHMYLVYDAYSHAVHLNKINSYA